MPDSAYTPHYHLRIPRSGDRRNIADFGRVFRDNVLAVDTQLKAHDNRLNALESGGGATVTGESEGAEAVDSNALAQLRTRLSALEVRAVTGFRKDDNSLWYAYNKDGQDVCGPFDFGADGGVTLAELFDAFEDDSVTYQAPTPVTVPENGPNITLSGIFNAVPDSGVMYLDPTPIVMVS